MDLQHGVSSLGSFLNTGSSNQIQIPDVPDELQIIDGSTPEYLSTVTPLMVTLTKRVRKRVRAGERFTLLGDTTGLLTTDEKALISTIYPNMPTREAILRYFHRVSALYVEIPSHKYTRDANVHVPTYTKFVTTGNMDIVKSWVDESTLKPSARTKLDSIDEFNDSSILPHLKLSRSKTTGEKSVVNARNGWDVSDDKIRAMPVVFLKTAVDTIMKAAASQYVTVTYTKDNREKKVITTTLNRDLLVSVYGEEIANDALEASYTGDFFNDAALDRGYIRVPSVGESRHADITRSLNYARIVDIEYDSEPDLSSIDVDITQVLPHFYSAVAKLSHKELSALGTALRDQEMSRFVIEGTTFAIEEWASAESIVGGTSFLNQLSLFMMANGAVWFPEYTGDSVESANTTTESGYGSLDHGLF